MLHGRIGTCLTVSPCFALCMRRWIEPLILALIVGNVVILILQSSRSVFKDPRKPGYFDYWEDYVLLAIFAIFT